jgi:acyl-coenzyme A thioesterase PaaI-like protein
MLVLMASFLDPRMEGGAGISDEDKQQMYDQIRMSIIDIGAEEMVQNLPNQHEHEQEQG